ncbi:transcriptional regulator, GntR family [Clostridium aceticum]|uniref:Transcriptional regulator, GntR family n=1 Tax=Clostridium aceticum TaxID=84022 RepID=A0A0D8IH46_9CLOT|nr:FadR/GntR family transcriptional regulator [Clostridium aceticum]AKL94158.1 transcriptional regulator, GntR family [Clostridium aceticum]KJF28496.1 GntR family transcriptional regulator [Clostridium aceticum]
MEKKKINTSEIVYRAIEEKIYNKEWTSGMKIASENQLSQDLGVSRMSVREAIEKMVALNILTKRQGEGTFVNELSPSIYLNSLVPMILLDKDNLLDVLEFREVIEADTARLCAERCDDHTIKVLEECYQIMYDNNDTSEDFANADYQFHMEIAKASKNSLIIKVNSILTDIWKFQQNEINRCLGPERGVREHKKILDAIKERDSELAALYMKRHVQRTKNDILAIVMKEKEMKKNI